MAAGCSGRRYPPCPLAIVAFQDCLEFAAGFAHKFVLPDLIVGVRRHVGTYGAPEVAGRMVDICGERKQPHDRECPVPASHESGLASLVRPLLLDVVIHRRRQLALLPSLFGAVLCSSNSTMPPPRGTAPAGFARCGVPDSRGGSAGWGAGRPCSNLAISFAMVLLVSFVACHPELSQGAGPNSRLRSARYTSWPWKRPWNWRTMTR